MYCTECGTKISDNLKFCTSCGTRLNQDPLKGRESKGRKSIFQGFVDNAIECGSSMKPANKSPDDINREILKVQKKQLQLQEKQYKAMAKCPKCGSTSLSGNKKGFGIGKAVVGGTVAGPLGLVVGNIGSGKVKVTCLSCGKQFKL